MSRLRRRAGARARAAVARAAARDVPAVSSGVEAHASRLEAFRTPTGRPAGRPVNDKPDAHAVGLFLVHHLLQLLAGTERWGDRRLDLNYPARLGIAAHARRALAGFEVPEAGDLDLCALLQLSGDDPFIVEQGLDRPAGVRLAHLGWHCQGAAPSALVHG